MGAKNRLTEYSFPAGRIKQGANPLQTFQIAEGKDFGIIMAIILNIDTAIETASISMARDGKPLLSAVNERQKDHGTWLHPAIKKMMEEAGPEMSKLEAIAVTIGPGSYTGLRIGLAAVKGLCFALQIPLIPVNTLEMMAYATRDNASALLCPLIDARRMEVFTAIYDNELRQILEPKAMIIDATSFASILLSNKIIFSGNGSKKLKAVFTDSYPNAQFSDKVAVADDMAPLAERYFRENKFTDVAYVEPVYMKEFYFAAR
jgi:tRNA threonylcarbamoyladenosine biosynthesis protein TsaB